MEISAQTGTRYERSPFGIELSTRVFNIVIEIAGYYAPFLCIPYFLNLIKDNQNNCN